MEEEQPDSGVSGSGAGDDGRRLLQGFTRLARFSQNAIRGSQSCILSAACCEGSTYPPRSSAKGRGETPSVQLFAARPSFFLLASFDTRHTGWLLASLPPSSGVPRPNHGRRRRRRSNSGHHPGFTAFFCCLFQFQPSAQMQPSQHQPGPRKHANRLRTAWPQLALSPNLNIERRSLSPIISSNTGATSIIFDCLPQFAKLRPAAAAALPCRCRAHLLFFRILPFPSPLLQQDPQVSRPRPTAASTGKPCGTGNG